MRTNIRSKNVMAKAADVCKVPCFKEELVKEIKSSLPESEEIAQVAALYNALADPSRIKILLALSHEELCVCDISHVVGLSVSATSHQLRLLRNLGLVTFRNDGRMAYYSLPKKSAVLLWLKEALGK